MVFFRLFLRRGRKNREIRKDNLALNSFLAHSSYNKTGFLVNFPDFIGCEQPVPARTQAAEAHRSVGNAPDFQNRMPDSLAHALYLAVPALVESDPHPGRAGKLPNEFNTGRGSYTFGQPDT